MKRLPKSSIVYVMALLSTTLLAEEVKWASYVEGGFITEDGNQPYQEESSSTSSTTATLSWGGNRYEFRLLGRIGNTWSYQVSPKAGQELSHWTLGIEGCKEQMLTFTVGGQMGADKSINDRYFGGLQWAWVPNKGKNIFSFTLREDYPTKAVEVLAKAGDNYNIGLIAGPACPQDQITNESVCSLDYKKKLAKTWYSPQWLKTQVRLVLSRKDAQKWVRGGKVKVLTGSYIMHPNENDSDDKPLLLGKPVPCPMEIPNCNQGEIGLYSPTSDQIVASDGNGIVEIEVTGWWPGVSKHYRDATNLMTSKGKPDWESRARYLVQTYYEGIVLGEKNKKLGSFHQLVEWDATMGMCQPFVLNHPPATDFWGEKSTP